MCAMYTSATGTTTMLRPRVPTTALRGPGCSSTTVESPPMPASASTACCSSSVSARALMRAWSASIVGLIDSSTRTIPPLLRAMPRQEPIYRRGALRPARVPASGRFGAVSGRGVRLKCGYAVQRSTLRMRAVTASHVSPYRLLSVASGVRSVNALSAPKLSVRMPDPGIMFA